MPYEIIRVGKEKYSVINSETGKIHSFGTSLIAANAQKRLLYGVEHGWRPSNRSPRKSYRVKSHSRKSHSPKRRRKSRSPNGYYR